MEISNWSITICGSCNLCTLGAILYHNFILASLFQSKVRAKIHPISFHRFHSHKYLPAFGSFLCKKLKVNKQDRPPLMWLQMRTISIRWTQNDQCFQPYRFLWNFHKHLKYFFKTSYIEESWNTNFQLDWFLRCF